MLISFGVRTYLSRDYKGDVIDGIAKIKSVKKTKYTANNKYNYVIKYNGRLFIIKLPEKYQVGDYLYIKGVFSNFEEEHIPTLFNEKQYYKNKHIIGLIKIEKSAFLKRSFTIRKIQYYLESYIEKRVSGSSSSVIKALILGISDMPSDMKESIQKIGISHLFVISGLHASLIIMVLTKVLEMLSKKIPKLYKYNDAVVIIVMTCYLIMTNFLISLIRVILNYVLSIINHKYNFKMTSLDVISLNTIIVLLINPYLIFNLSFILSYLLAITLTISGLELLKGPIWPKNNKVLQSIIGTFFSTLLCTFFSLPIVINFNNEVNILSLIANLIYIPFVSYVLLPASFLTFVVPFLDIGYKYLVKCFLTITKGIADIDYFIVILGKPNIIISLSYYVILVMAVGIIEIVKDKKIIVGNTFRLKSKKTIMVFLSFILLLIVWGVNPSFNHYNKVIFFDLPIGESTLIVGPYNKYHILIDTGEKSSNHEVLSYLLAQGIRKLDYCFITHSDTDHVGELENISTNIKIDNLVLGTYDNHHLELKKVKRVLKVKAGKIFNVKGLKIQVLSPILNMNDTNNNSLVLMFHFKTEKWLFLGDIEEKAEQVLVDKYANIICDLVKIAHHGSLTSTSSEFLKKVKFKKAVIMSGYRNSFNFPNPLTIKKLIGKELYLTKNKKTIILNVR